MLSVDDPIVLANPRPNLATAIRSHWFATLVVGIVLAVAGVAVGLVATPTYTSTGEFQVGTPDVSAQAVPGYVAATQSLASTYARQASSAELIVPVARRLGLSAGTVGSRLSVTSVPDSNDITLSGTGRSASAAQRLASTASVALAKLVRRTQNVQTTPSALTAYQQASVAILRAQARIHRLQAVTPPISDTASSLLAAQTALATAQLQADALSAKFVQSQQASSAATGLETLTPAGPAGNNRSSVAQKAALVGLFAGLVLGALLSYLIEARRRPKFAVAE